ncbi:SMI1/KNR4 family protein [Streptomyces sp. SID13726]|uniref:SMI1/KNR4 family protein n=1 Tax=Streptomyces sp. SID13726 TaxID=2706058 RepID=UPI0013BA4FCE|nr:SMI1/KNR4 family protein [Streptomyces sp. SID13726]NEB05744.1 SMI1/KNR4 family protein [Streptomyces sp. SID13726]
MAEPTVSRRPLDAGQIDRRLARIRELLTRWDALRPGDGQVWRRAFVPIPETEVAAFEARNGLRLPENYRRYLLEFGDPGALLMRYGAQPFGEKDEPGYREPFPLHESWAGRPDEITEWEEAEGTDFFDAGPGEFYAQFDDPREAFYDLPAGADPDDGTLILGATRSHMLARLVLNGPWAGTVWLDSFGYDGQLKEPADDRYDGLYDAYALREFAETATWLPLAGLPWFPAPTAGFDDPAPADFLDLTTSWLRLRVRQAEAERACDRLDAPDLAEAGRRLRSPEEHGGLRGHRYGGFGPYIVGLIRDELLRPEPDPAARARIVEVAEAAAETPVLPTALILSGRWRELRDFEQSLPEARRSPVNQILAAVMLGAEPPVTTATLPSRGRTSIDRWALLHTLTRTDPARLRPLLDQLPDLRPLLDTAQSADTPLAGDLTAVDRDAGTVALVRALHATAADTPATGLVDGLCALAVAVDRVGEVFHLLAAVAGDRWADWHAAQRSGRGLLDTRQGPAPSAPNHQGRP